MKVRNDRGQLVDVADAVAASLDSNSWEGGALERARDQAENNSRAIGKLVALLVERGVMNADDVGEFLSWRYKVEEESGNEN